MKRFTPTAAPLRGLLVVAGLAACGGSSSTPAAPRQVTTATGSWGATADIGPHAWVCGMQFETTGPGFVSAYVVPATLYLELHRGACASPDDPVTTSTNGRVQATLPSAVYHLRIGNPTDETVHLAVQVDLSPSSP